MTGFVLAPDAEADVDEIAEYIAERNPKAAEQVVDDLYAAFQLLAISPGLGHRRNDLTDRPVLFWLVRKRYLVVYSNRVPIEIVRVLSAYRDVAKLLR